MKTANMVMTSMHKQKRPKSLAKTWSNSFLKVSQNTQRMKISDTVAQVIQMRLLLIKFYLYPFRWLLDQPVRVKLRKISKGDPDAVPSAVCVPICTYISREWHLVFQGSWEVHDIVHMRNRGERVSWCRHETLQVQASAMSFHNLKIKSGLIYFNLR